ncbi:hypothetical protein ACFYWY_15085 [Streptomyces sp. NPDC002870]|uniref:hypothetical protein n=1 Tax=Streptomyces sp. NPDC002870 TaxID=3364666 RepID=UPI0036809AAA
MRSGWITLRTAGVAAVLVLAPAAPAAYAADSVRVTVVPAKVVPGGEVEVLVSGCQGMTGAARSQGFVTLAALASRNGAGTQLFGETTVKASVKPGTYDIGVTCDGREHPVSARVQVVQLAPNQPSERPDEPPKGRDEPTKRSDESTKGRDESTKRSDESTKGRDEPTERSDESSKREDRPTEKSYEPTEDSYEDDLDKEDSYAYEDESSDPADDSMPYAPVRAGGGGSAALAADGPADPADAGPGIPQAVIGLVLAGVAAVVVAFRSSRRRRSDSD